MGGSCSSDSHRWIDRSIRWNGYHFPPGWNPLDEYLIVKYQTYLTREVKLKPESPVLEIGSGWGRDALWFASCGFNIIALEIDGKYCRAAKENFKIGRFWNKNAVVVRANGQNLPFKEDLFDLIFCKAVLHHVPNVAQMIIEMHRVLKRKGVVMAVCEPNKLNPLWHLAKFLTRSLHSKSYILAPDEFTEKTHMNP